MGAIKFFTGAMMIALFSVLIVSFAIQFGEQNNTDISIIDDADYSTLNTSIMSELSSTTSSINDSSNTFFTTTQEKGDQSSSSGGQFKGGIREVIGIATVAITAGFNSIFGKDGGNFAFIFTALTSILVFISIAYGWKYLRGNPD